MKIYQHLIISLLLTLPVSLGYACLPSSLMTSSAVADSKSQKISADKNTSIFGTAPQEKDNLSSIAQKLKDIGVDYEKYKKAISGHESGDRLGIRNKDSGAAGLYQFMPSTLRGLGYQGTMQEFLASRELQDQYMDRLTEQNFNRAYQIYGNNPDKIVASLASMHYSGSPTKWQTCTGAQVYGSGTYTSIAGYAADIIRRYNRMS